MSKIIEAGTHGAKRNALVAALQDHKPFRTSGALRATDFAVHRSGWLTGKDKQRFWDDYPKINYIVWSYDTPIAWITLEGEIFHVEQTFTRTTSKHQGTVRAWLK